jgi:hypothetical protein
MGSIPLGSASKNNDLSAIFGEAGLFVAVFVVSGCLAKVWEALRGHSNCPVSPTVRLWGVSSNVIIRFVMAICLLVGLVTGPASIAAPSHATASLSLAMSHDMDCCPKKPSAPRCAKCPLMALCSSPFTERLADLRLPTVISRSTRRAALIDEAMLPGRSAPPLPEPPRSSV